MNFLREEFSRIGIKAIIGAILTVCLLLLPPLMFFVAVAAIVHGSLVMFICSIAILIASLWKIFSFIDEGPMN